MPSNWYWWGKASSRKFSMKIVLMRIMTIIIMMMIPGDNDELSEILVMAMIMGLWDHVDENMVERS